MRITRRARAVLGALLALLVLGGSQRAFATHESFEPGDIFLSVESGPVQWRLPDGSLPRLLVPTVVGTGEGMAFDAHGNLYVTRWCVDPMCKIDGGTGTVEWFNVLGQSMGAVGSGYDCSPHSIVFDRATATVAYVSQAGCTGAILKFVPGQIDPVAYDAAPENQGTFWIDIAADGCTLFYTSWGPSVKRYDTCAGAQLADFNAAPLPGGAAQDLRILPDGGVLVSSGAVIARLDASGTLVQTYSVAETSFWAGLELLDDGTFWAVNYETSNVYRFDLAGGGVVASFYADSPPHSIVGIRVKRVDR